jgi:hypothetical protein
VNQKHALPGPPIGEPDVSRGTAGSEEQLHQQGSQGVQRRGAAAYPPIGGVGHHQVPDAGRDPATRYPPL